ncbi:MAG: hypothetical protein QXG91_02505 [Candidatus Aenigmatarchaeota archaeon]
MYREIYNGIKKEKRKIIEWLIGGATIYGTPAIYRYITRSPILLPEIETLPPYIPSNLLEKLIVNSVAPGGVGAIIGEAAFNKSIRKYIRRIMGSVSLTSIWTLIQYIGYYICDIIKYEWPSGGNPFESPNTYPFNLLMALTIAPLFPYLIDYFHSKFIK